MEAIRHIDEILGKTFECNAPDVFRMVRPGGRGSGERPVRKKISHPRKGQKFECKLPSSDKLVIQDGEVYGKHLLETVRLNWEDGQVSELKLSEFHKFAAFPAQAKSEKSEPKSRKAKAQPKREDLAASAPAE